MVVVVNVGVDFFNQLSQGFKPIQITVLILEPAKETLFLAILPGGAFITDRYFYAFAFKEIGNYFCHKFAPLVAVEDIRSFGSQLYGPPDCG